MKDTVSVHASSIFVCSLHFRALTTRTPAMTTYSAESQRKLDIALLILRLVLAAVFITHGYQKVFVYGFAGVTNSFTHMGVPLPGVVAPFVAIIELVGGFAMLFGAFARVAGFLLACDMLGAIIIVHAKN